MQEKERKGAKKEELFCFHIGLIELLWWTGSAFCSSKYILSFTLPFLHTTTSQSGQAL